MVSAKRKEKNRKNHKANVREKKQQAWEKFPDSFLAMCHVTPPFQEPEDIEEGSREETNSMLFAKAPSYSHFNPSDIHRPYTFTDLYSIHAKLGRTVMKGWHKGGCIVAMKKLHVAPDHVLQLGEVRALSAINHENVVKLFSLRLTASVQYLVLEYCHFDLDVLIHHQNVKIDAEHIKGIAVALLSGLKAIHEKNVAHRNLTPGHVLITKNGILKITDFALAVCTSDGTHGGPLSQMANIRYLAPEYLLGCTEIRASADLWNVGVIIGELFLRSSLFDGENERDQIVQVLNLVGELEGPFYKTNETYQGIKNVWRDDKNGTFLKVFEWRLCNPLLHDSQGVRFVRNMMEPNYNRRCTVDEALEHEWLKSGVRGDLKVLLEVFEKPCHSRIFRDHNDDGIEDNNDNGIEDNNDD